jgi:5-methylcytosine-specific restriction enzyme A
MPSKPPSVGSRTSRQRPWDHGGKGRIERGYDHRWTKLRLVVLARDQHLCQPCHRAGRVTASEAVDHIIPKAKGGTDDLENLEAICESCHRDKTTADQGKRVRLRIAEDGWPS